MSVVALAGFCQTGGKKDDKADQTKKTEMTASITVSRGGAQPAFGSHLEPILKTVSASEDQRKSITAIMEDFKTRIVPLRKRHDELRETFFKTLTSGQTGDVVLAAQSDFIRAQTDLSAQYLALRLKVSQVLTEEQNVKYAEYRKKQGWNKPPK